MPRRIGLLRKSGEIFPLDRRFRIASASFLGNVAMQADQPWKMVAVPELQHALLRDPTQADLLAMLIALDLSLGRDGEAQLAYNQFKFVAKKSPLLDVVRQAKQ